MLQALSGRICKTTGMQLQLPPQMRYLG